MTFLTIAVTRATVLSTISVFHSVSIILTALALAAGTAGILEALAMVLNWFAIITITCYLGYMSFRPSTRGRPIRHATVYGVVFPIGVANTFLFLMRIRDLCQDFSGSPERCVASNAVVATTSLSALLGLLGLVVEYFHIQDPTDEPEDMSQIPVKISWPLPASLRVNLPPLSLGKGSTNGMGKGKSRGSPPRDSPIPNTIYEKWATIKL